MPSVLLGGRRGADPAGSRAVLDSVRRGLPNHDVSEMSAFSDPGGLMHAARRSAAVVVAGASMTPTVGPVTGAAVCSTLAMRPLALLGIGSGPIPRRATGRLAKWALGRADLLLLADEMSAANLAAAGAPTPMRVAADPAWLALTSTDVSGRRGDSVVVVLDGRTGPAVEKALGAALVTVARAGRRVRIVPWAGPGTPDEAMGSRLAARIATSVPGAAGLEPAPASLPEAAALFADAFAVVAFRYRAVHAAAAAGVPVIGVGTEPGIVALARRLGQPVVAPASLAAALPRALERTGPASAPSPATVKEEMVRAEAGLRLLRLVVEPDAVGAAELDHLPLVPVPWL
jgi:polysaccharide pyruvyl transferase WcaK-like protein